MRYIFLFGMLSLMVFGCEEKKTIYEIDDELIRNYLTEHSIEATKHSSGLYYIIEKEGNGQFPTINSNIEVLTLGYYLDSTVFQPNTYSVNGPLSSFWSGWQYGIPLFSKGGKGKLFLPRYMGDKPEVCIFDIELRNVW